jgi:hypothetical protein
MTWDKLKLTFFVVDELGHMPVLHVIKFLSDSHENEWVDEQFLRCVMDDETIASKIQWKHLYGSDDLNPTADADTMEKIIRKLPSVRARWHCLMMVDTDLGGKFDHRVQSILDHPTWRFNPIKPLWTSVAFFLTVPLLLLNLMHNSNC